MGEKELQAKQTYVQSNSLDWDSLSKNIYKYIFNLMANAKLVFDCGRDESADCIHLFGVSAMKKSW